MLEILDTSSIEDATHVMLLAVVLLQSATWLTMTFKPLQTWAWQKKIRRIRFPNGWKMLQKAQFKGWKMLQIRLKSGWKMLQSGFYAEEKSGKKVG